MHMLRKTMGMAMPMRLAMEKKVIHIIWNNAHNLASFLIFFSGCK